MACSDCINQHSDLGEFIRGIYPNGHPESLLPFAGSLELTLRCNVRCKHCYIIYPGATDDEMSTDQVKKVLDELSSNGVLFLLLSGGEVLARPDFMEIYLYAKQRGLILSIFTNATLVTQEIADFFVKWPPRKIEVSIYGHTEKTYEAITGVHGSFKRFRNGIDLLMKRELPVALKTMVMKTNLHEFEAMKAWAEELGCAFRFDAIMNTKLNGDDSPLLERLSARQVVELEATQEKEKEAYNSLRDFMGNAPKSNKLFTCGAGVKTFHVDPKGQLHGCMMWRSTPFNLLENSLKDGWKEHINQLRRIEGPEDGCTTCGNKGTCGRCPALSFLEMGDASKSIPYHCEVGNERKRVLMKRGIELSLSV